MSKCLVNICRNRPEGRREGGRQLKIKKLKKGFRSRHQSIFPLKMEWCDWTPTDRIYVPEFKFGGLITGREGISTLHRPFQERLPI